MKSWLSMPLACIMTLASPFIVSAHASEITYPFTAEEDSDGARFVWFMFCTSGAMYKYIPARDFPNNEHFRKLNPLEEKPSSGDIAWWPEHIAIYVENPPHYMTATSSFSLPPDRPQPDYYRMQEDPAMPKLPPPRTKREALKRCQPEKH